MSGFFRDLLIRMKSRGIYPKGFIDAGAHFGETNATIRQIYPDSRIVSFEANPNCESILKSNTQEYIICLLGKNTIESVPFYINPNDKTSTGCSIYKEESVHFKDAQTVQLPMYKLDDIIPDEANMEFLKMDVQGAEIDILDGSTRLLNKIKWIYLEVSFVKCNEGAPLFSDVFLYMNKLGYSVSDICEPTYIDNKLIQCNFLFEKL
jgi:FkbM family methyltransferase